MGLACCTARGGHLAVVRKLPGIQVSGGVVFIVHHVATPLYQERFQALISQAQPPLMPEPTTMASKVRALTLSILRLEVLQ